MQCSAETKYSSSNGDRRWSVFQLLTELPGPRRHTQRLGNILAGHVERERERTEWRRRNRERIVKYSRGGAIESSDERREQKQTNVKSRKRDFFFAHHTVGI
jgi:hypothetical protein